MNAGELVSLFRNEVMDTAAPYMWSDTEVYVYLNDAYSMLVRFVGGVEDISSPAVTSVSYSAGATEVSLHPSVLRIVRAFNNAGTEIPVIESTDRPLIRDTNGNIALLNVGSSSATDVQYLVMGADHRKALLHPIPTASGELTLQVRRLPITEVTSPSSTLPDLQPEHHYHLLKWMKSLAYRKQDVETFNLDQALLNENAFLQYASQAAYEIARYYRKSVNSVRSRVDLNQPMLDASASRLYQANMPDRQAAPKREA